MFSLMGFIGFCMRFFELTLVGPFGYCLRGYFFLFLVVLVIFLFFWGGSYWLFPVVWRRKK